MSEQTANLCTTDAAESLRAVVAERDREIERLKEGQSILILARDEQKRLANEYRDLWSRATLSAPSHGEQVQVEAVAVTREDEDGELYLDWLLEGGISALEFEGQLLLVAHGKVTDESGHGCVIAAAPSAGSQEQGE